MVAFHSDFATYAVVGFVAGLFFFFKGFRVYREYRVLTDTPEQPIRSIPMGLVHIHGKAKAEQVVNSPVTRTPCLFYKVEIERWRSDSKGGGSWTHYKTDADGVQFHLEDATGKVLVDAHGAEYDLMQTARREIGRGLTLGIGTGLGRLLSGVPAAPAGAAPPLTDDALLSYVASVADSGHSSLAASIGNLTLGGGLALGSGSSGRYRLTEFCILPEHWYDVTGSCVENPAPKDEHDRNMIVKGQNEPTFLISWRSEQGIESRLRNRAALHIFGGGALAVVCLGVLLKKLGWL